MLRPKDSDNDLTAGRGEDRIRLEVTPRKFEPRARGIVRKVVVTKSLRGRSLLYEDEAGVSVSLGG